MRTVADVYRDEGIEQRNNEVAIRMLEEDVQSDLICKVTGLRKDDLNKLKSLNNIR